MKWLGGGVIIVASLFAMAGTVLFMPLIARRHIMLKSALMVPLVALY
ncbi:MAG: hypothetical protein ACSLEM_04315 [Candidatus Malihini olakiniferum]